MLGDTTYDSANLREELDEHGTKPVIPNRCNRRQPFTFNKRATPDATTNVSAATKAATNVSAATKAAANMSAATTKVSAKTVTIREPLPSGGEKTITRRECD